jgi:hypothetical protein
MLLRNVLGPWAVAALLVACGSSGGNAASLSPACSFNGALPVVPKNVPESGSAEDIAKAQGLTTLGSYLEPFLNGGVGVYKGTLSAHDNQGVLNGSMPAGSSGYVSQTVDGGPAIASLTIIGGIAVLSVHSFAAHKYVVFSQETSDAQKTTTVGIILADSKSGGNTGTCTSCVPSLAGRPKTIDFSNLESTQIVNVNPTGESSDNVTLHTFATASLELVSPCDVTFDDIAELNAGDGLAFTQNAGDWTAQLAGYAYPTNGCATSYTVELYVSATNLANFGVRDYAPGEDEGCYP